MNVWIVFTDHEWDWQKIDSVHATEESADARARTLGRHCSSESFEVTDFTVSAEKSPVDSINQQQVLEWAVRSFGAIAKNSDERAARLAEEAIEIAQCEGVPLEVIIKIAQRVYSRPAGERWQEIGGTGVALLAYAENAGLGLEKCIEREWTRLQSKSLEWWKMKHAEKVAAGTADLSPVMRAGA
jgi:hypothetical protein